MVTDIAHTLIAILVRFAYDGEWKFADLLTMTAGKLAVKFVVDSVTGIDYYMTHVPLTSKETE